MKHTTRQTRRTVRAAVRDRARTHRANARIHRRGTASLTTWAIAAGLTPRQARSVASTLRKTATRLGITGVEGRVRVKGRMRTVTRYTPAQIAQIAAAYRPRKAEYKAVQARLALAA